MESFGLLGMGLANALTPTNLLFALIGCTLGMLVGVLPGVGPTAGIAVLIPLTFKLDATGAIIMLAAIYYGAMYGGTITSVLLNTPGEAASVVTTFDGYQMARQGRGGVALGIAAIGSFIGGTIATFGLVLVAPPLARFALSFGPAEQFALLILGLSTLIGLTGRSVVTGMIMGLSGLMLGLVGLDPVTGAPRLTFGIPDLFDGVEFVTVVMGLFGFSEILINLEQPGPQDLRNEDLVAVAEPRGVGPLGRVDRARHWARFHARADPGHQLGDRVVPVVRGRAALHQAAARDRCDRRRGRAGDGQQLVHKCRADPAVHAWAAKLAGRSRSWRGRSSSTAWCRARCSFAAEVVWTIIASLYVGNVMLLIMNLPLLGLWVSVLKIRYPILMVLILIFSIVGSYSLSGSIFDVGVMFAFGVLGYFFKKLDLPMAPLVLALVLGPLIERALRTSLEISARQPGHLLHQPDRGDVAGPRRDRTARLGLPDAPVPTPGRRRRASRSLTDRLTACFRRSPYLRGTSLSRPQPRIRGGQSPIDPYSRSPRRP